MQKIESQKIIRGQPAQIAVVMANGLNKLPVCGLTSMTASFKKEDPGYVEKSPAAGFTFGFGDPTAIYSFDLSGDETSLLETGSDQTVYMKITYSGGVVHKYAVPDVYTVVDPLF